MKYRAVLSDPDAKHERPQQTFANSLPEIERWAAAVLTHAITPDASVNVYQTAEQQIKIIMKPKQETDKPKEPIA